MKLYDENKNLVGEIEKPKPIKHDEKWWEFLEYRAVEIGEKSEEPRFSVGEIMNCVKSLLRIYDGTHYTDLCRMIEADLKEKFTERRRG